MLIAIPPSVVSSTEFANVLKVTLYFLILCHSSHG